MANLQFHPSSYARNIPGDSASMSGVACRVLPLLARILAEIAPDLLYCPCCSTVAAEATLGALPLADESASARRVISCRAGSRMSAALNTCFYNTKGRDSQ